MRVLDDGRINCKVRIEGSYKGENFIYEDEDDQFGSQYIWPAENCDGDDEQEINDNRASRYWWEEGNLGCDCNRCRFLPPHMEHSGDCGHTITINKIIPIEGDNLPILILND